MHSVLRGAIQRIEGGLRRVIHRTEGGRFSVDKSLNWPDIHRAPHSRQRVNSVFTETTVRGTGERDG